MAAFSKLRRTALIRGALGLATFVTVAMPWARARSQAGDPPEEAKLSENDPLAQQLMYVHEATRTRADARGENEFCHNCRYFRCESDCSWGPCDLFPGKVVNAQGWCNVWALKN